MVQTAIANVVSPTIAADNPDGTLDEEVGHRKQIKGLGLGVAGEFLLQLCHAGALRRDTSFVLLISLQDAIGQFCAEVILEGGHQLFGVELLLVAGEAEAQAEFGVVLEEAVGPDRPAAIAVLGPRGGG
ncbi:MAG: hypothetical protein BWX54_01654 [Verrucomicrobia bacterium ADurb.Bin018]|nr:MAG: hypothetical protein BWX54_01654 [Verrucomicrobia bacterium ADurb.Bin018]